VVFVTYGGTHLGPKEAEPALSLLDLNIEHLRYKCIGRFSCPGGVGGRATPGQWFGDISGGPDERDLQKAGIFMAEITGTASSKVITTINICTEIQF